MTPRFRSNIGGLVRSLNAADRMTKCEQAPPSSNVAIPIYGFVHSMTCFQNDSSDEDATGRELRCPLLQSFSIKLMPIAPSRLCVRVLLRVKCDWISAHRLLPDVFIHAMCQHRFIVLSEWRCWQQREQLVQNARLHPSRIETNVLLFLPLPTSRGDEAFEAIHGTMEATVAAEQFPNLCQVLFSLFQLAGVEELVDWLANVGLGGVAKS